MDQQVACDILDVLIKAVEKRDSSLVDAMHDTNGVADPEKDKAPGISQEARKQSLPPPEITLSAFQNRGRTSLSHIEAEISSLSAIDDKNELSLKLTAIKDELDNVSSFAEALRLSVLNGTTVLKPRGKDLVMEMADLDDSGAVRPVEPVPKKEEPKPKTEKREVNPLFGNSDDESEEGDDVDDDDDCGSSTTRKEK